MPLKNIPNSINPELLYALARMGHGDTLVIADSNFPSDSVASNCFVKSPIRVHGKTSAIFKDILSLITLDQYVPRPVEMMDRVQSDKDRNLEVTTYSEVARVAELSLQDIGYVERFEFYRRAKGCFVVIQTDDTSLYANILVTKGVVS